jgi:diguanylate cyclase (GGDEF)-like protein
MSFEQPIFDSEKNKEEQRKKIIDLKDTDNYHEDSIHDMALAEDQQRELLKSLHITDEETLNKLGDVHSDVIYEAIVAKKENWIDEMTQLRKKTAFNQEVPQMLSLETRFNQECSMLVLDLDFFSKVNNEYGHLAGDQVLKVLAQKIKNSVRKSDFVYKYGGEEFVVFLPNTNSVKALVIAEKIRKNIEDTSVSIKSVNQDAMGGNLMIKKTISIGIVGSDQLESWRENNAKRDFERIKEEMFLKADKALIDAKNSGRNKFVLWNGEDAE